MSKRRFETRTEDGTLVEVVAGWDPPLERLFLVVNRIEEGEDGEDTEDVETLFTNLDWENGPEMKMWEITAVLSALGLPYPPEWIQAVGRDEVAETANVEKSYGRKITGHHPPFDINSDQMRP